MDLSEFVTADSEILKSDEYILGTAKPHLLQKQS